MLYIYIYIYNYRENDLYLCIFMGKHDKTHDVYTRVAALKFYFFEITSVFSTPSLFMLNVRYICYARALRIFNY